MPTRLGGSMPDVIRMQNYRERALRKQICLLCLGRSLISVTMDFSGYYYFFPVPVKAK